MQDSLTGGRWTRPSHEQNQKGTFIGSKYSRRTTECQMNSFFQQTRQRDWTEKAGSPPGAAAILQAKAQVRAIVHGPLHLQLERVLWPTCTTVVSSQIRCLVPFASEQRELAGKTGRQHTHPDCLPTAAPPGRLCPMPWECAWCVKGTAKRQCGWTDRTRRNVVLVNLQGINLTFLILY